MATISPIYARCLAQHLLRTGIAGEAIFAGTGLEFPDLWCSDELDLGAFRRILENAEAIGTEPPVGFLIGSYHNTWVLGPLGAAMGAAPSVRASLQLLETFTRLHASYIQVETHSGPLSLDVRINIEGLDGNSLRHHVESSLSSIEQFIGQKQGRALQDAVYRVPYSRPDYADDYPRYLNNKVLFDQEAVVMTLPLKELDERSVYFHEELWQTSLRQLSERLRELGMLEEKVYGAHVSAMLRSHSLPLPTLGEIAESLHVSERTLNRRLQYEETSFRELRGQAIDRLARQYLEETDLSVEAIAALLGYQDAANFRRAFRKRMGLTPGQFRNKVNG